MVKRLLNTLYVTTSGSYLAREGETVLVRVKGETRIRVPVHTLDSVVCFGQVSCSPAVMGLCAQSGVSVAFLTEYGRFLARMQGPVSGNVLLRREQYRLADDTRRSASIARSVVAAKIANCRGVIQRAARDRQCSESGHLPEVSRRLARYLGRLRESLPLDEVRGVEGEAARTYFSVFDDLIVAQKNGFYFHSRSRRPPLDNMNALLSFVYTLLVHDVRSALEAVGLDPAVGYLHRDRPGRPGLALDLMEELRPVVADRLALSLVNRRQIKPSGFRTTETRSVVMNDKTRKSVLVAYHDRKQEEVKHAFLGERVPVGLLPHCQAVLFARFVRGDLDGYPPLFWK